MCLALPSLPPFDSLLKKKERKKGMDDYSQCFSGERSDLGGIYIRKGDILLFYFKASVVELYCFHSHNIAFLMIYFKASIFSWIMISFTCRVVLFVCLLSTYVDTSPTSHSGVTSSLKL